MKSLLKPGRYQHYKGQFYQVIGTGRHSESGEDLALYFPLYGIEEEKMYWVRPLTMFTESVTVDGKSLPRFSFVDETTK